MTISYRKDKKSGITYAYECTSVWVPELKQARNHRKYLGRVDENGNIIPSTGRRGRPPKEPEAAAAPVSVKPDPDVPAELRAKDLEIARLKTENAQLRSLLSQIGELVHQADVQKGQSDVTVHR